MMSNSAETVCNLLSFVIYRFSAESSVTHLLFSEVVNFAVSVQSAVTSSTILRGKCRQAIHNPSK